MEEHPVKVSHRDINGLGFEAAREEIVNMQVVIITAMTTTVVNRTCNYSGPWGTRVLQLIQGQSNILFTQADTFSVDVK